MKPQLYVPIQSADLIALTFERNRTAESVRGIFRGNFTGALCTGVIFSRG